VFAVPRKPLPAGLLESGLAARWYIWLVRGVLQS